MIKVFIDTDKMKYKEASGSDIANLASFGFHGNINIFKPGYFWTDFIQWCNEQVPIILKKELKKQGLNIK